MVAFVCFEMICDFKVKCDVFGGYGGNLSGVGYCSVPVGVIYNHKDIRVQRFVRQKRGAFFFELGLLGFY